MYLYDLVLYILKNCKISDFLSLSGVGFVYLRRRTLHRLVRHVCNRSIGIFQSIKRTSIALWQRIKAAVTHVVMQARQDRTCTDVHQQKDTHAVTPTRQDRTGEDVTQQTDTHAVTPTRKDRTGEDVTQQTDTHAVTPTRKDRTGEDVTQQTDTHAVTPTRKDRTGEDVTQQTHTHAVTPTRKDRTGEDVTQQTDTHAVTPTRKDRTGEDVTQQTDTHAVTPTRKDRTGEDVTQQTDTHAVTPTRKDRTGEDVTQQTDTHAVTPTREDSTCTDVHQQTDTLIIHTNTTHTSSTCSYNTASTSIRSVSSEFFTASSPIPPVTPQKGSSSSLVCASVRGSSSHGIEYSPGQYILGGSLNLEVLGKLGEGGFGTIYKVQGRDSIYAAKVSNCLRLEDVHEEFATLSEISHVNIIHVLEKLPEGYLMVYCPNDLDHLIKNSGPVKLETCFDISLGIARAVVYIHSQYLAHLDIKPSNILLTESGSPKLADFGGSMYFRKLDGTLRLLNHTAGTFGYAPPEMLDFKSGISMARMDSWCLGATFFEMMTGRRPFKGETKAELLANQLRCNFDLPRRFVHKDTFSSEYMTVIRNLCTVKPKARIFPAEAKHHLKGNRLFMMLNAWDREDPCY